MRRALAFVLVPSLAACNLVIGIGDRQLDPTGSSSTGAGAGGATAASVAIALGASSVDVIGTGQVSVTVTRTNAPGPVAITLQNLPPQVTADILTIPAGQTSGVLILHDNGAAQGISHATVIATAAALAPASAALDVVVRGASGTLDTSFGTNGYVPLTDDGEADAIALDSKGNIVLAGFAHAYLIVERYAPNGTPDPTFGTNGMGHFVMNLRADPTVMQWQDAARAVVVDGQDRPLVAIVHRDIVSTMTVYDYQLLARFTNTGLDTSFGSTHAGYEQPPAQFSKGGTQTPHGLALLANGEVVMSGEGNLPVTLCATVAHYDSSGVAIHGDGLCNYGSQSARGIVYDGTSDLILVGAANLGSVDQFYFVKFNVPGGLVASWGTMNGTTLVLGSAGESFLNAGALDSDGGVVAVGSDPNGVAALRVDATGKLDTSYGTVPDHVARVKGSYGATTAGAGALDKDGNFIVDGWSGATNMSHVLVARLAKKTGDRDMKFGSLGLAEPAFGTSAEAHAIAIDAAGRILVAGTALDGSGNPRVLLARFWP